jgi:pimeloyl-ACP methyl ester carboxylesterase
MIGYVYANQHSSALSGLVTVGSVTPHLFSTGEWLYFGVMLRVVRTVATNERILNGLTWVLEQIFDARAGADGLERLRDEHHCDVPDIHPEESEKMLDAAVEYYGSGRPVDGIDVPVLMLYGDDELPFLQAHADYLEDRLSACRTVEIPDAGHNAHADNPEFIRDRLREFMATTT